MAKSYEEVLKANMALEARLADVVDQADELAALRDELSRVKKASKPAPITGPDSALLVSYLQAELHTARGRVADLESELRKRDREQMLALSHALQTAHEREDQPRQNPVADVLREGLAIFGPVLMARFGGDDEGWDDEEEPTG